MHHMSMCLVRLCSTGFLKKSMHPLLSTLMLIGPLEIAVRTPWDATLCTSLLIQTAYLLASHRAMYSASIVDSATDFYNLEPQLTAAPPKMKVKPVVERRVSWSPAQSASI